MHVTIVKKPKIEKQNMYYSGNKAPLLPNPIIRLPLGSIKAKGWLKHQLHLMEEGMVGRLKELSKFLAKDSSWLISESINGAEEVPYWLRGFYDLAVLTDNRELQNEAMHWIEAILTSQQENGYFGPLKLNIMDEEFNVKFSGCFVHSLALDVLIHYYEYTGDERVISLMNRFFKYCNNLPDNKFVPAGLTIEYRRPCELIPQIHWLYNQTGDDWLLDLAARYYKKMPHPTDPWPQRKDMLNAGINDSLRRVRTDEWLAHHTVDFTHRVKYPAVFYPQSHARWHFNATEYWYLQHMSTWGQPRGIFSADEVIRSTYLDPRQGCETCTMVELNKVFYMLGQISGDAKYADRCEDIMYNHFTASQTPDLKGLHYLTASNQPQLDNSGKQDVANNQLGIGKSFIKYSPHDFRCCQHNVAMGWPWFVENLWQATPDNGLVAWIYAPSEVIAKVGSEGKEVKITEDTQYPFKSTIQLKVEAAESVEFPLYLRIPKWAKDFHVKINDLIVIRADEVEAYVCIERVWSDGDRIDIRMPLSITLTEWPRNGSVTVDRGPLSYSIKILEEWKVCGGTNKWPEWEVIPLSPWNYGLILDREKLETCFIVNERDNISEQPWTLDNAPIEITVEAKRIPGWQLDNEMIQELRPSPVISKETKEYITLIPLGCARLRLSCIPTVSDESYAKEWR